MNRVLAILGSCFIDLLGFVCAVLAASAFIHLLFLGAAGFDAEEAPVLFTGSIFSIPFVALFVAYFALLPTAPVILVGEILGRRDWLFYALGGAFVGLAISVLFWRAGMPSGAEAPGVTADYGEPGFFALLVATGVVGGVAYWLVAGRQAGSWRGLPPRAPHGA